MKKRTADFPKPPGWVSSLYFIVFFPGFVFLIMAPVVSQAEETEFNYNIGPALLEVSSQAPGQSFRYSPIPCAHEAIVPRGVDVRLGGSWANILLKSGGLLEFAIIENVITYDNSPDFGIHLAYTYRTK